MNNYLLMQMNFTLYPEEQQWRSFGTNDERGEC